MSQPRTSSKSKSSKSDSSKVHKLALKGSSKVVNEFVSGAIIVRVRD
jgi:mitotic spindle assembly checkpoint protein MAD2